MDFMGITGVAAITVICYLIAEGVKATAIENKWLPVICGVFGAVLGVVAFFIMPGFPGEDILTSVAIGIVSGFAATGVHQLGKQISHSE